MVYEVRLYKKSTKEFHCNLLTTTSQEEAQRLEEQYLTDNDYYVVLQKEKRYDIICKEKEIIIIDYVYQEKLHISYNDHSVFINGTEIFTYNGCFKELYISSICGGSIYGNEQLFCCRFNINTIICTSPSYISLCTIYYLIFKKRNYFVFMILYFYLKKTLKIPYRF